MTDRIYVVTGLEARRAAVARTGRDPGEVVAIDMSGDEWAQVRERIAPRLSVVSSPHELAPRGSLRATLQGAADVTPDAICAELSRLENKERERERRAEVRRLEREEHERQRLERLRQVPVTELISYRSGSWAPTRDAANVGREAEAQAEAERRNNVQERAEAERAERKAEEQRRAEAERADWIGQHGSERLRRLAREGIELRAVYRDERLAHECPGWRWGEAVLGSGDEPRNAPEEALVFLDEARAALPEGLRDQAQLRYWVVEACDDECPLSAEHDYDEVDEDGSCPGLHDGWRGYAVTAPYLGRVIVYGGPVE